MSRQWPVSRIQACTPFACACVRDEARIFAMAAMLAGQHEDESAHAAVEQRARDIGQHELAVPGRDAAGHQHDPRIVRNLARPCAGPRRVRDPPRAGSKAAVSMLARNDGDPLARQSVALHHRCRRRSSMARSPGRRARARRPSSARSPEVPRHVGQRGDQPDRDLRGGHAGAPGAAGALGMHDVDALAAISCSSVRALRLSLNGLAVALPAEPIRRRTP